MLENDNHHIIYHGENAWSVAPGASTTLAFRATPGGRLTLRVGAKKAPSGPEPVPPIEDPPISVISVADLAVLSRARRLTSAPSRPAIEARRPSGPGRSPRPGVAEARRPTRPAGRFGDPLGTIDFDEPREPPIDVPDLRPAMNVRIGIRGGATLSEHTGITADFPQMPRVEFAAFPGHDVIEVTIENPSDFPVHLMFFLAIQNQLELTTTLIPDTLLSRVFNDALLFFSPSLIVKNGQLHVGFNHEAEAFVPSQRFSVDAGVDVGLTLEAPSFELIDHEAAVREVLAKLRAAIGRVTAQNPSRHDFKRVPEDFVEQSVAAFFGRSTHLPHLYSERMGLHDDQWRAALERLPLLHKQVGNSSEDIERTDVALRFNFVLTEIAGGTERLQVEVDKVEAALLLVLRSGRIRGQAPDPSLPRDYLPEGYLRPRWDFSIDFSGIEVEMDLGENRGILEPLVWLAENIAEEAVEAFAEWMEDSASKQISDAAMTYLNDVDNRDGIGAIATMIAGSLANRDHALWTLRRAALGWAITTIDRAQLAVPFVAPDSTDHRFDDIGVNVDALGPIDGPMPADASERLQGVDHLVFLMMENRSFDHMLGFLSHPNHSNRSDVEGLDGRAVDFNGESSGTLTPQPGARLSFPPGPGHSLEDVAEQVREGAMDGFVSNFAKKLVATDLINHEGNFNDSRRIHAFYTPDQIPTYDVLTRTDAVLDHWFSSIPGPTYPNRFCYYTGLAPELENREILKDAGYHRQLTIFDFLDREGIDWRCFESDVTFIRMFESYRIDTTRIRPIDEFLATTDRLPSVTFIDPNFKGAPSARPANDDHAPTHVHRGQIFIKEVIESLQRRPGWDRTMLVVTYDEHGGFADHVPPPGTPTSGFTPQEIPSVHPELTSYGVRVPTFVVGPMIEAASVGSQIYDHATPFRTIIERFMPGIVDSSLLPERVRRARHLGELVADPALANTNERVFPEIEEPGIGNTTRRERGVIDGTFPEPDLDDMLYGLRSLANPFRPT